MRRKSKPPHTSTRRRRNKRPNSSQSRQRNRSRSLHRSKTLDCLSRRNCRQLSTNAGKRLTVSQRSVGQATENSGASSSRIIAPNCNEWPSEISSLTWRTTNSDAYTDYSKRTSLIRRMSIELPNYLRNHNSSSMAHPQLTLCKEH